MRKYSVLAAAISALLLALISTPANASVPADGTYLCTTGASSADTPNFTITSGVVSAGTACAGAVVIPAGVTSIGTSAFKGATSLTSITIPDSVISIGDYAFGNATSLTSITVANENPNFSSLDGVLFNLGKTSLIQYPAGKSQTSYSIPASVTSIGDYAFNGATALTSITIPASVTSIGIKAFYGTTALTSVYFLDDAPTVGSSAFASVAAGAKAYIETGATGFGSAGDNWNGLVVEVNVSAVSAPIVANAYRADKLATVYFSPLSSKLSKADKKQLEAAVIANPSAVYKITGYVQKSIFAKNAKNDASLSLARAKAIETHLASLGAGVTFTVVTDAGKVPVKNGKSNKARRATLYAMTPVVQ